jgi:hypothetical protein
MLEWAKETETGTRAVTGDRMLAAMAERARHCWRSLFR